MGIKVEKSIVINRPPEEVFAFISDAQNDPQWSAALDSASYIEGGPGEVGSTVRLVVKFLSREFEAIAKITAYEPNKKMDFELIKGPVIGQGWRQVEAVGGGTQLTLRFDFEFGHIFNAVKFLLKPALYKNKEDEVNNIKSVLEG